MTAKEEKATVHEIKWKKTMANLEHFKQNVYAADTDYVKHIEFNVN